MCLPFHADDTLHLADIGDCLGQLRKIVNLNCQPDRGKQLLLVHVRPNIDHWGTRLGNGGHNIRQKEAAIMGKNAKRRIIETVGIFLPSFENSTMNL